MKRSLRIGFIFVVALIATAVCIVPAVSQKALDPEFAPELPAELASRRFALLIGNQNYSDRSNRPSQPHNDVDLIGQALDRLGLEVTIIKDATKKQLENAVDDYINRLKSAGSGIGFFYYAGIGGADIETKIQYLVTVDFDRAAVSWDGTTVNADELVAKFSKEAPNTVHYVVFDTSRDEGKMNVQSTRQSEGQQHFAMPLGLLVAYPTAPGTESFDITGERSGPYAEALAEEIGKPGIESVTMFRNVHFRMRSSLRDRQTFRGREQNPTLFTSTFPLVYLAGKYTEDVWPGGKRLALLIGNKDYVRAVGPLINPPNDVDLVRKALEKIGFEVLPPVMDAKRGQLMLALLDFANKLKAAGPDAVGFLYYSGHGAAVGTENYLIPVDVEKPSGDEYRANGISLKHILDTLKEIAPEAVQYLVFDACRNNLGGSRGGKGFVPEQKRYGMYISYASDKDKTASDEGQNGGPYATVLAEELVRPGKPDYMMFHKVKVRVDQQTKGEQVPWTDDGIRTNGRFFFAGPN